MHEESPLRRRELLRLFALAAGGLALGQTLPAFAAAKPEASKKAAEARKFTNKVIWDFEGCMDHPRSQRVQPFVHEGQVYAVFWMPGLKTYVVKVPLAGGKGETAPLMPGHVTGEDPHRGYRIAVDPTGRVHVVGDMHGSAWVKHWLSKKPKDISAFEFACGADSNAGPAGAEVTYPGFFRGPEGTLYHSIRCGIPAMGVAISVLDAKTQTWSILGASIPRDQLEGQRRNMAAKTGKHPVSIWEDNGEGGSYGYMQPHAKIVWDRNKRMHIACSVLNKNTPSAQGRHTHTHVLYAYSDDGGKTIHRGDGTEIRWPMRAEEGPYQGDVVYAETEGNPPWLKVVAGLRIDDKNRPVVSCHSFKTGGHSKVLEKGKWVPVVSNTPGSKSEAAADQDDDDDLDDDLSDFGLTASERRTVAMDHFRDTGEVLFVTFPDMNRRKDKGFGRIQFVLRSPIKAK